MSIFQDQQGVVWLGTYNGLNRFDGYEYKVYKNEIGNNSSLVDNSIYSIDEDTEHNIWVGGRQGISVFNPKTARFSNVMFRHPIKDQIPLSGNVHQIIHLKNGNMLVASENWGVVSFESKNKVGKTIPIQYKNEQIPYYDAKNIVEDTLTHRLWFFVENKGLFCYDMHHGKMATLQSNELKTVSTLSLNNRTIWIGNTDGLFAFDTEKKVLSANMFTQRTSINALVVVNGRLWIGTDGQGVFSKNLSDSTHALTLLDESEQLKSNSISSLMRDKDNQLWIGTLRGGCSILYQESNNYDLVKIPSTRVSLADNFIFTFYENKDGNVWIGTDGAGLKLWNRKDNTFSSYKREEGMLNSNFVTGIRRADADQIWLSSWFGGVIKLDIHRKQRKIYTLFNTKINRVEKNAWFLYTDSKNGLWASTTNNGTLYQYDAQLDSFRVFDERIDNIQAMQEDDEGQLWAGNYNSLILLDPLKKQHKYYRLNYAVRSILDDHKGFLWVGTEGGGLLVIDKKTMHYKRYTTLDGLPDNAVLRLLPDAYGNIWMSTFGGLASMHIARRIINKVPIENSEKKNQFSYNAAIALSDGTLLFGGINGISAIKPNDSFAGKLDPYTIGLRDILVNNSSDISPYIKQNKHLLHLTIPYSQNSVALSFSIPEFLNPEQVQYSFKLKDWDINWSRPSSVRNINYSRLSPGTYTLEVKSSNVYNRWSSPIELITLTILPPWYATWWAYLLYFLFIAGVIAVYIRYVKYKQQMRYDLQIAHMESQQEKERNNRKISFFTNISHELRTPLTLIINPLKTVLKKSRNDEHIDVNELSVAYKNARRLLALMDQLMLFRKADEDADALNSSNFEMGALIEDMCHCFDSLANEKQIEFAWKIPQENTFVTADKEKIEIILFNLLSNAFKYTPEKGKIEVFCSIAHNQQCDIKVLDSGTGIPADIGNQIFEKFKQTKQSKKGFGVGLYLVKHFAEMHGGSVGYSSKVGETLFEVQLPIVRAITENSLIVEGGDMLPQAAELSDRLDLVEIFQGVETPKGHPMPNEEGIISTEIISPFKKILIVEDEAEMRSYLSRLFEKDYIVRTAANGEEASSILATEMPDIVLSDIQMDKMNGIELCNWIKSNERTAHIPVILLTSASAEETQIEGINAGADNYVVKPFDSEVLKTKIKGVLENRTKLQQYFFNKITLKDDIQDNSRIPQEYQEFVQQCIQIVEANLEEENFDIKRFCKEIGMSHSALYKKVKSVSGQTINKFIRSIRLRRAAVLMLKENYSVNQAAFQVGIGDIKYFREQFKTQFGMNPSEYIKKYRTGFRSVSHKVTSD